MKIISNTVLVLIGVFILLSASVYSQTWTSQTSGTSENLFGVWFNDTDNGIAVGDNGTILRTTDGGSNWSAPTTNPTSERLRSVCFFDATTAVAVGNSGTIIRTTDAGDNWSSITSDTSSTLTGVRFTDSNNGIIVGASGIILRTTNGGLNWTLKTSGTSNNLNNIFFQDANTAYVVGNSGDFLETTDAGTNWSKSTISADAYYNISFSSSTNAVATSNSGVIARTTDGGVNWSTQTIGSVNWRGVYFIDLNTGYISGAGGNIYKTEDGGANWSSQSSGVSEVLFQIFFDSSGNGTIVGYSGTILRASSLPTITGVTLASDNSYIDVAWDEGIYNTSGGSGALETSDFSLSISGGTATNPTITSVTNTSDGALTGGESTIRINFSVSGTPDGGETLTVVPASSTSIYDAAGNAASTTQSNNTVTLNGSGGGGSGSGYFNIIYNNGDPASSTDLSLIDNITISGSDITFTLTDASTVVKAISIIDKFTIDGTGGGDPLPVELNSFTYTLNENQVTLSWSTATEVDNYGFEIQRNSNLRGQQGVNENSDLEGYTKIGFVKGAGNSNSPKEYSFVDEEPPGGTIKYRLKQIDTDGEFAYSEEIEVEVAIPEKFALYQNYPNPFNPSTTIKFDLPEESPIKLIIYNILGEQVAELVNEIMPAGYHKVEFNANNFASGIYIYRIQAKDFTSVKKMLMVK